MERRKIKEGKKEEWIDEGSKINDWWIQQGRGWKKWVGGGIKYKYKRRMNRERKKEKWMI